MPAAARLLALALLLSLAAGGCTLLLPSRADKAASFTPFDGETVSGVPLARLLRQRTCAIVNLPEAATASALIATADGSDLEVESFGTAIAIAEDGYFLTAAHCLAPRPSYVLVRLEGRLALVRVRVVWKGDPDDDTDLAIVKVDGLRTSTVFAWASATEVNDGTPLVSVGYAGAISPSVAAGRALGPLSPPHGHGRDAPATSVLADDVPTTFGDSGGPVATRAGRLVGVNIRGQAVFVGWRSVAVRPEPAWIAARIEADRAGHR
jgi:S1-C subfamily serine protease